jgi:hypothetical protein
MVHGVNNQRLDGKTPCTVPRFAKQLFGPTSLQPLRVAHRDMLDESLVFSIQVEDIFEHANGKCHVFTF